MTIDLLPKRRAIKDEHSPIFNSELQASPVLCFFFPHRCVLRALLASQRDVRWKVHGHNLNFSSRLLSAVSSLTHTRFLSPAAPRLLIFP